MPIVNLELKRLQNILGKKVPYIKILESLPFLGLDIEEQTKNQISVEYSPNRPDFSTDYGIALGLQGLLGLKTGIPKLKIKKEKYTIKIEPSVRTIRPFITSIIARDGKLDDQIIKQIISMQEDLHNGLGRKRKKASIGFHDLDTIEFPITYKTTEKNHKFIPLNSNSEMSIAEILAKTEVGIKYGKILDNSKQFPVVIDSKGNTLSFPPIINSNQTTVTKETQNLLVEVTSIDKKSGEDILAIVALVLHEAGFSIFSTQISGQNNLESLLKPEKISLDSSLVNQILGSNLTNSTIIHSLRKCRLDAKFSRGKINCTVPRYRTDIFGPMDLVEEVALGYGIQNLEPILSPIKTVGQKNRITTIIDLLSSIMVGLGYSEVMNFSLISKDIQYDLTNRDSSNILMTIDSKSQEHVVLRDSILPGLIETLSKNIHESYPQKLFETGIVFLKNLDEINEEIHLACIAAHNDASFSEIKSTLQSVLKNTFGLDCTTQSSLIKMFTEGRSANIVVKNKQVGVIGEVSPEVLDNFKLRIPVVGFEAKLTGLIFD